MSGLSRLTANQGGSIYVTSPSVKLSGAKTPGLPWMPGWVRGRACRKRPQAAGGAGAKKVADRTVSSEPCSTIPK